VSAIFGICTYLQNVAQRLEIYITSLRKLNINTFKITLHSLADGGRLEEFIGVKLKVSTICGDEGSGAIPVALSRGSDTWTLKIVFNALRSVHT
jgi:hypothetical protein